MSAQRPMMVDRGKLLADIETVRAEVRRKVDADDEDFAGLILDLCDRAETMVGDLIPDGQVAEPPAVRSAAQAMIDRIDFNHDTKTPPLKYTVPWAEATALREALRYG